MRNNACSGCVDGLLFLFCALFFSESILFVQGFLFFVELDTLSALLTKVDRFFHVPQEYGADDHLILWRSKDTAENAQQTPET